MTAMRTTIDGAASARGTVVVVDVLRAFTTAACALAAGAAEIVLVETVEEAFELRDRIEGSLLMGEVRGRPIDGFDFGNSPAEIRNADLAGRRMIQRTSNGTLGMVRSTGADRLLAGSFVCATATARWIQQRGASQLSWVITGRHPDCDGDEDVALADYLDAILAGHAVDPDTMVDRVRSSFRGAALASADDPQLREDLALCAEIDRFDFAMPVTRRSGLLVLAAEVPDAAEEASASLAERGEPGIARS